MSKQLRTLVIVLVAVALLGGGLATLLLIPPAGEETSSSASETTSSDPGITLIEKSVDAEGKAIEAPIKKATIKTSDRPEIKTDGEVTTPAFKGEEFILSPGEDEEMRVEKYADLEVSTYAVSDLTSSLASIVAGKLIKENPEDPALYGFDTPRAEVTVIYYDDVEYSFEIGNSTPLNEGYYFREKGKNTIYLVSTIFGETVSQSSLTYIGTSLYAAPPVDTEDTAGQAVLRDMRLSGRAHGQTFAFRGVTSSDSADFQYATFLLTSPYLRVADTVLDDYAQYTSLAASEAVCAFPTEDDLKSYGLDDPYSTAEINLAIKTDETYTDDDGEEATRTMYYNVRPHTVKLGNKDKSGNYYCMVDEIPVIYLIDAASVPWATLTYDKAAGNNLFMKDITTVDKITVVVDGKKTEFQLGHFPDESEVAKKLTVTAGGVTYDTTNFRYLYQVFMKITRLGPAEVEPTGDPVLEIRLDPIDKEEQVIHAKIYKATASSFTCQMSTGEIYRVSADSVDRATTQIANYLAGKTVDAN